MDKWQNKVAVVTGANSGLGLSILRKLAQSGVKAVGFDIETDHIEKLKDELKGVQIHEKILSGWKRHMAASIFSLILLEPSEMLEY